MGAYLLTYGVSQLFYGPISDRVGRRPAILVGMSIFMLATLVAVTTSSLTVLIAASAMQGWALKRWRRNGAYFAARFI